MKRKNESRIPRGPPFIKVVKNHYSSFVSLIVSLLRSRSDCKGFFLELRVYVGLDRRSEKNSSKTGKK